MLIKFFSEVAHLYFLLYVLLLSGNDVSETSLVLHLFSNALTTLEEAVYGDVFPILSYFAIYGEQHHFMIDLMGGQAN